MNITNLLIKNIVDIMVILFLLILSVIRVFPPTFAGLNNEYFDIAQQKIVKQRKVCFLEIPFYIFGHLITSGLGLMIGFRGTLTLLLFIVIGADLYLNRKITNNGVTLSIVALVALYLEKIVDNAEEISLWKFFTWKSKKTYMPPPQS